MHKIQEIFNLSYNEYCNHFNPTTEQNKAAYSIMNCKSGKLGCNISICDDCGHLETHNNSCRNRHCPCCQAVLKELWIDNRKSEVIDAPYFHVVFTLPAELNPLIYANQNLLYSLLHKCVSQTLLELSVDKKHLGATPGIIQILHTWGQELNFHPHIHCIVAGAGLTKEDYRTWETKDITITHIEFIRRFLTHILPCGFQKIRYYGFLNNRYKKINLKLISKLTGKQLFKSLYSKMSTDELLLALWNINIHLCPHCGGDHFRHAGRTYHNRN